MLGSLVYSDIRLVRMESLGCYGVMKSISMERREMVGVK